MKVARLASGLGLIALYTACGRSVEPSAPSASATSASSAAPATAEEAKPESPAAAPEPAPPPPAGPQGLDQPKSKKAQHDTADFTNLEDAERALNQAKADLDRLALAEPAPSIGRNATEDRAAEKDSKSARRAPSAAGAAAPTKSNAVCDDACRAFSSLTRAANAVCRLDGSSGSHCTRAKHVLSDAQQRVASCSCPAASD